MKTSKQSLAGHPTVMHVFVVYLCRFVILKGRVLGGLTMLFQVQRLGLHSVSNMER
jgi:hypothetical protein